MLQKQPVVLLVEDSPLFLAVEKTFLQDSAVKVLEATTVEQALTICHAKPPHLIFLASEVSGKSGITCCHTIKTDPELVRIPVVLIAELHQFKEIRQEKHVVCDAVLSHPLDQKSFLEALHRFLPDVA